MASLTYIATAAIISAANSATGGGIIPEALVTTVASCLVAIVDGLLVQQWTVPEIKVSRILKETLPTALKTFRRQGPHA